MAYCAASDVYEFIQVDSDTVATAAFIAYIGDLIPRAKAIINSYCNRTFEGTADAATTRYFDVNSDVQGQTLFFDDDYIYVASDYTLTNGDATTVATSDIVWEPRNTNPKWGVTILNSSGLTWMYPTSGDPQNAISLAGQWVYSNTAPADIAQACIRLVAFLYKQRESDSTLDRPLLTPSGLTIMPGRIPQDVIGILEPYRRRRVG